MKDGGGGEEGDPRGAREARTLLKKGRKEVPDVRTGAWRSWCGEIRSLENREAAQHLLRPPTTTTGRWWWWWWRGGT